MDEFPAEVKSKYLEQAKDPNVSIPADCPYCKGEMEGQEVGDSPSWEFEEFIGSDEVRVRVQCGKCGKYWYEYYGLVGIEAGSEYEEPEEQEIQTAS